jgi:hypothetical protein
MPAWSGQQDLFIEAPIWWDGLTGPRRKFVEYYCTDTSCFLNAAQAYIKACAKNGKALSDSSIHSNSSRMLRDPKVRLAIAKLLKARQAGEDSLNEYRLLKTLQTLAFYNPKDLYDEHGSLKKLEDLGDLALCVAGIEPGRHGRKIKLYDRTKAIELLMRYLELARPAENAVGVNPNIILADKDIELLCIEEAKAAPEDSAEDAEYEVMEAR